jgi:hypothetical protein
MPYIKWAKGNRPMTARNIAVGLIVLTAFYTITFGGLAYSARTDPYRVSEAHGAVHGIVIYPYGAKRERPAA